MECCCFCTNQQRAKGFGFFFLAIPLFVDMCAFFFFFFQDRVDVGDLVLVQDSDDLLEEDLSYSAKVHVVRAEELSSYTLADVVIPIPGTDVVFPDNYVGVALRSAMSAVGVEMPKWVEAASRLPIKGGYRKLICVPKELSHEIL